MMSQCTEKYTGLILAGGRATRMGGRDKGLMQLGDMPLVNYAVAQMRDITDSIVISANRNQADYARLGYPICDDGAFRYSGPLAGMLSAMREVPDYRAIITLPCDMPLVTSEQLKRLVKAYEGAPQKISVAHDGERLHPVVAVIPVFLADSLFTYLRDGGRKLQTWMFECGITEVDFSDCFDRFINVNTPEQLAELKTNRGACVQQSE